MESCPPTSKAKAEMVQKTLAMPAELAFVSILNAYLLNAPLQLKQIADALAVVPSTLTHYKNGDRAVPVEMFGRLAQILNWPVDVEQLVFQAWRHDRAIIDLRRYVAQMFEMENYRQIDFVIDELHILQEDLHKARQQARNAGAVQF